MKFGFKNITDDARHSLEKTGIYVQYHSGLYDEVTMVDVNAPEGTTQVMVLGDKCRYYFLINDIVYTKTDGPNANSVYPGLPHDVLILVPKEHQEEIKNMINNYYLMHRSFSERPF